MINVNKKVLWISDYELDLAPGGSQRSDKILIDKGKILGFNILKVNKDNFKNISDLNRFDIIVSSNLAWINQLDPSFINKISNHHYHVRVEHDSNAYLNPEQRRKLFSSCKKTFFLSDYHYAFFKELYGDFFKNVVIIPDPIDKSKFYDKKKDRENKILYAGYMHEGKGADFFFEYVLLNPDKQFVLAGWSSIYIYTMLAKTIKNIDFLGTIDHKNMPDLFNKYKTFFYEPHPDTREPFCRSVAEALLCGINIMTRSQDRIGCLHEFKKLGADAFIESCNSAADNFWKKI